MQRCIQHHPMGDLKHQTKKHLHYNLDQDQIHTTGTGKKQISLVYKLQLLNKSSYIPLWVHQYREKNYHHHDDVWINIKCLDCYKKLAEFHCHDVHPKEDIKNNKQTKLENGISYVSKKESLLTYPINYEDSLHFGYALA